MSKAPGKNLACPKCGDADFSERASFKAVTEPLMGAPPSTVVVDLMNCKRCGFDLPTVRGKKQYSLVPDDKLAGLQSELEGERQRSSDLGKQIDGLTRRAKRLEADIERTAENGVIAAIEEKITLVEAQNARLEETKARIAAAIELVSATIPG